MKAKNSQKFDKIKKMFEENYSYFLKNVLLQAYKIKNQYEFKSLTNLGNNSTHVSLTTSLKDIFNYQSKKISTDYLIQNEIKNKFEASSFLDDKKYIEIKEELASNIIKLNNSTEENPNILFRLANPVDEKIEIRMVKNQKNDKETFLQLWQTSALIRSIKLEEKGIKSVYCDDVFGRPKFSPDGKKLIFTVEKDLSKNFKNYFSINNQNSDKDINDDDKDENKDDEFIKNMKKFDYRQEFGEALDGKADPVIAVFDILRNDIGLIDLDEINFNNNKNENNYDEKKIKIYPATPFFDVNSNDILFAGYQFENDFKLGIIFCLKRPCKIYLLKNPKINWKNADKEVKDKEKNKSEQAAEDKKNPLFENKLFIVSEESINSLKENQIEMLKYNNTVYNYCNFSPLMSADGKFLCFLSNEKSTAHMNGLRLNLIDWAQQKKKFEESLNENKELQQKFNNEKLALVEIPGFKFNSKLAIDKINFENNYFCGIYCYNDLLSKSLFISNDKIIINTNHQNSNKFLIYDITKELLIQPYQTLNISVFDSKTVAKTKDDLFFSLNSYVNVMPFTCMWKIDNNKYNSTIDKILKQEENSISITQENHKEFSNKNENNGLTANDKIVFDKIVNLETENFNATRAKLSILYLGENNTNEIFEINQIENENYEYFFKNTKNEESEISKLLNFNKFTEEDLSENSNNNNFNNKNLQNSKADYILQENFKQYLSFIITNSKVNEYKYNGVHGYFIHSESIFTQSENQNTKQTKSKKRPIVYFIHGGPNGNLSKKFLNIQSIFLSHGYGVLVVNYPGSTGYGQAYLKSLNGNIGSLDVQSCGEFLQNFISENKEKFNLEESKTIIYGGSHGGFLGAWLICDERFKSFFSSAVLRNPVTDLASMMACTDIPDWVLGQGTDLDLDFNFPPGSDVYAKFYEKSPVYKAHNSVTPTLIKLGKQDKRVNYFNGLFFYQALKHQGCKVKLHVYPEDSHPLACDETDVDCNFTDLTWMRNHLN